MRTLVIVWTFIVMCLANLSYADDKDKAAEEDKKFEGIWQVTALEVGGNKAQNEAFETMTFVFKGKKYEQKVGDEIVEAGTQDLNPSKTPKHMDVHVTEGDAKGKLQLAIYEINGDTLKMCFAPHESKDRPLKFESKEPGHQYLELKRKK